jgi:hypothetical protein
MIAQEIMARIDQSGNISLDTPLIVNKPSRVKLIVLFIEDEDDESKEAVLESLKTSLQEAKAGKVHPISELHDNLYPLRGKVIHYDDPTEPVALEDWECLQ